MSVIYIFLVFICLIICILFLFDGIDNLYTLALIAISLFFLLKLYLKFNEEKREEKLRNANMQEIQNMSGEQFELYLKAVLKAHGYKVETTSRTGDFGADLILKNKENEKIVVQAKRYKGNVGIKSVQEVLGAKNYYSANNAWVITNSYFTKPAKELAAKSDVMLIDRKALLQLAREVGVDLKDEPIFSTVNETVICPKCESPMILRKSKHGTFYGCSKFPRCRSVVPVNL